MLFRKILLSFLFLFSSLFVLAQQKSSISGLITDSLGTVEGVSVLLKNTKIGTASNAAGFYQIMDLKPGQYTIVVSYLGTINHSKTIKLGAGEQLKLDFMVKESGQHLNTIAVKGQSKTVALKESGFSANGIETKLFLNTTTDLNQLLNQSTGVKVREQGAWALTLTFRSMVYQGGRYAFSWMAYRWKALEVPWGSTISRLTWPKESKFIKGWCL
jgi:hypothetical protein